MYDLVVVGARCAGASVALLAARAECRVLLIEKSRFPSDIVSTHLIHQPGVARLEKWGLLNDVVATGCPPIDQAGYRIADVRLEGRSAPAGEQSAAYAPRRYLLDQILVDAATSAGAEFRDRSAVISLVEDEGRIRGVRYKDSDGTVRTAQGRIVVGADGMRSTVARLVQAQEIVSDPIMTFVYYAYWRGLEPHFRLFEAQDQFVGMIPTNHDQTVVAAYFPQRKFDDVRRDARRQYLETATRVVPELGAICSAGGTFDRLYAFGEQRNFFRKATGRGWALVGDAGHHKDSITAHGISDAFLQADLFADTVVPFIGSTEETDALEHFETARDEALTESYHKTLFTAKLDVTAERLDLLRKIEADPSLTDRYFSVVSGVESVERLYAEVLSDV